MLATLGCAMASHPAPSVDDHGLRTRFHKSVGRDVREYLRSAAQSIFSISIRCDGSEIRRLVSTSQVQRHVLDDQKLWTTTYEYLCGDRDGRLYAAGAYLEDCNDSGIAKWIRETGGTVVSNPTTVVQYRRVLCREIDGRFTPNEPISIRDQLRALGTPAAFVTPVVIYHESQQAGTTVYNIEFLPESEARGDGHSFEGVSTLVGIRADGTAYIPETIFYEGTDNR